MKPAPFNYHAPRTLDDALALLREAGDGALVLAGGQSLVPMLNLRLARPEAIIDLNRIPELAALAVAGSELRIGAMVRHLALERDPAVAEHVPLLAEAAGQIAHLQIRTRGTLGGSLANAAPAAEWPAVVAALEARLVVRSAGGERTLAPEEFFAGPMMTTLEPGEILVEVRVPVPGPDTGWAFIEFARRHGDFALAGAAVLLRLDGVGRVARARLAMCGMAEPGMRLSGVESALVGSSLTGADLDRFEAGVAAAVDAPGDIQLSPESRREVAGTIARRALVRAAARAGSGIGAGKQGATDG